MPGRSVTSCRPSSHATPPTHIRPPLPPTPLTLTPRRRDDMAWQINSCTLDYPWDFYYSTRAVLDIVRSRMGDDLLNSFETM